MAGTTSRVLSAAESQQGLVADAPDSGAGGHAGRTGFHDDPVIRRALVVVGQPVNSVTVVDREEIRMIYTRLRAGAPPDGLNAFTVTGDPNDQRIYVNSDSDVYRRAASTPSPLALLKLAATLVHEQVHDTDGEHAAYRVQSDFVRSKLSGLPRRQQAEARRYLQGLEARACARAHAERVLRERRMPSPGALTK
jgi:hypothetical protein